MMADNVVLTSRIVQLAETITRSVSEIDKVLLERGLPSPSFSERLPIGYLPKEVSDAQSSVLDATSELHDLLLEPLHLIKRHGASNNSVCMQAIARYGISSLIPPEGSVSFVDLGNITSLGEQMICRLLRFAMTMRIFCEPKPGFVAHTQASRLLASPEMTAWLRIGTEEMWPAATKMLDALEKWPASQEPNETAYSYSQNSNQSIYDVIGGDAEKGHLFAQAMKVWATRPDYAPSHAVEGYNWAGLVEESRNKDRLQVVDIGGGHGHVAVALAHRFPNLDFIVQDMAKVIEGAKETLPQGFAAGQRVQFMAHDLFAQQTIAGDIFFFRWILHNWADKYCIAVLRAQIPVLKPTSRIIIMEACLPDPGQTNVGVVPLWMEADLRSEDLNMGAIFNSRERTLSDWNKLLVEADARFVLKGVTRPKGSALSLMEVVWEAAS